MEKKNPIESIIDVETDQIKRQNGSGAILGMLSGYGVEDRSCLLGFLLKMDYAELTLVTCDAWKRNCGESRKIPLSLFD